MNPAQRSTYSAQMACAGHDECWKGCSGSVSAPSSSPERWRRRDGVVDFARRSVRWRVPVRWYLIPLFTVPVGAMLLSHAIFGSRALASPAGGLPRVLAEVGAVFLLQLVLFQLAEEIGFTGFLQHHWQSRYHPMKLTVYVALLWALCYLPDHVAAKGWGVEALISAPDHLRHRIRVAVPRPCLVRVVL
jgi:hypothetical protein